MLLKYGGALGKDLVMIRYDGSSNFQHQHQRFDQLESGLVGCTELALSVQHLGRSGYQGKFKRL